MPSSIQPFVSAFGSGLAPVIAPTPASAPSDTTAINSQQDNGTQPASPNSSDPSSFQDALNKAGKAKQDASRDNATQAATAANRAHAKTAEEQQREAGASKAEKAQPHADPGKKTSLSGTTPPVTQSSRPARPARRADADQDKSARPKDPNQSSQTGAPLAPTAKPVAHSAKTPAEEADPAAEPIDPTAARSATDTTNAANDAGGKDDATSQLDAEQKAGSDLSRKLTNFNSIHDEDADDDESAGSSAGSSSQSTDGAGLEADTASASDSAGQMVVTRELAAIDPKTPPKPGGATPDGGAFASAPGDAKSAATEHAKAAETPPAPEARFAEENHSKIVTGMHSQLLPGGGSMQLRLDPPHLGDLRVSVHMQDGVMTAAFETTNDEATKLLSHSLGQLKSMLEAQGVSVQKLHVQQAPRTKDTSSSDSRDRSKREPTPEQRQSQQREQQRKALIQKMWDKLAGKAPVDVVA